MARPLLETKFHVPPPVRGRVERAHLTERLQHGAAGTLTLDQAFVATDASYSNVISGGGKLVINGIMEAMQKANEFKVQNTVTP